MAIEDRSHRSHELNPRKHPIGLNYFDHSKSKIAFKLKHIAMLSDSEMHFIHDVPRILGPGDYANLGHAYGGSAILLADSLRENNLRGKVYSVDLFSSNKYIRRAHYQIDKFDVNLWIELCYGSTSDWAEKLNDKEFNFVFVDADHTYEAVKTDVLNWSPLVKVGGFISLHDTNQEFSHKAITDTLNHMENWTEHKDLHIDRIRTFMKIY